MNITFTLAGLNNITQATNHYVSQIEIGFQSKNPKQTKSKPKKSPKQTNKQIPNPILTKFFCFYSLG